VLFSPHLHPSSFSHVYLDHNSFIGPIPPFYANLGKGRLRQLNLNDNMLTGEVPWGWEPRDQLTNLNVVNNNVTVPIDERLCEMSVFELGVMVEMRVDCDICTCDSLCHTCGQD